MSGVKKRESSHLPQVSASVFVSVSVTASASVSSAFYDCFSFALSLQISSHAAIKSSVPVAQHART